MGARARGGARRRGGGGCWGGRSSPPPPPRAPPPRASPRAAPPAARARAAVKELEFDHRRGKVSDGDYRAQVGPLRRRAAEALRALERGEGTTHERIAAPEERAGR